jgi:tetratricopeptide (TPR) repeat protein
MKKHVLTLAFLCSIYGFGQKNEIESAIKLVNSNPTEAKNQLISAQSLLSKTTEPQLQADLFYNLGTIFLKENNVLEAAKYFSKVSELENKGFFEGKNKTSKEKLYFLTEQDAKQAETSGEIEKYKQKTLSGKYVEFIKTNLNSKAGTLNDEAAKAYQAQEYEKAGNKFSELHYVMKALNNEEPSFYYYAAAAYYNANQKDKALPILNELISSGFTGVSKIYLATDKKTGKDVNTKDKNQFELVKLNPDYTNFREETTPSMEGDIYHLASSIYFEKENYDKAIEVCEKGLSKAPEHKNLSNLQGAIYHKSGQSEKFIENLKKKVEANPKDEVSLYNLGVMYADMKGKEEEAKIYYNKALEVNPKYIPAYTNLASLVLKPDADLVKQMNALKNTPADTQKSKVLVAKRKDLANKALPYLLKANEIDSKDISVVSIIKRIYGILENDAKYNEFRNKEIELKKAK